MGPKGWNPGVHSDVAAHGWLWHVAGMMWLLALALASTPEPVRLDFIGDVSFAGRSDAPAEVFAAVAPTLATATFAVANVEGLLLAEGAPTYREARLDISAHPRYAAAFAGSGIDLLGTANNHSWDAGAEGVLENLRHLAPNVTFGSGADVAAKATLRKTFASGCVSFVPATLKSNRPPRPGAVVAYYPADALDDLYALVSAERAAGCAPIVSIHWGREAVPEPPRAVVAVGEALVKAGAAAVVGHHPHVLQGITFRDGPQGRVPIAWSLGNFVFKNRDPDKRRTGILQLTLGATGIDVAMLPVTIDVRTFRPRPATAQEAAEHLVVMTKRSPGTKVTLVSGRLRFE